MLTDPQTFQAALLLRLHSIEARLAKLESGWNKEATELTRKVRVTELSEKLKDRNLVIIALRAEGWTHTHIASAMGIDLRTVYRAEKAS